MLTQVMSHAQALAKILAADHDSPSPLCGTGLWAGIDAYRGYHPQPFLGAPMDLFRIPKFDYYFFQSQRPAAAQGPGSGPMVFIANYASFLSPAVVTVFSNCEEVHLYRNGQEVTPEKSPVDLSALPHPPQFFPVGQTSATQSTMFMTGVASGGVHIGELKAEGLIGGKVVATQVVRAPGKPNKIVLEADLDGRDLIADGSDWVRVYARVCDPRGTTHPFADDLVRFTVSGEGELIGDARIANNPAPAQAGIATALIRASSRPGAITVRAEAFGLQSDEITIQSKPPSRQFLP